MMDTYTVGSTGCALKRIRTPHAHDVLSGRGGGINSHEGNRAFREWVRERKNQYNLALSKAEKARVAKEVITLVQRLSPPGRFLQRDLSAGSGEMGWWIEIDEAKAMAKTSQALREGAPQIRAAHKDDIEVHRTKPSRRSGARKYSWQSDEQPSSQLKPTTPAHHVGVEQVQSGVVRLAPAQVSPVQNSPAISTPIVNSPYQPIQSSTTALNQDSNSQQMSLVPPLMPANTSNNTYVRPAKRARVEGMIANTVTPQQDGVTTIDCEAETPPLAPVPAPLHSVPSICVAQTIPLAPIGVHQETASIITVGAPPPPPPAAPRRSGIKRANSLALSDIPGDWSLEYEFVNPFEDESELENNFFGAREEKASCSTGYVNQQNGVVCQNTTAHNVNSRCTWL